MRFHFSFSKLRKRPVFTKNATEKCEVSKSRGVRPYSHDVSDCHVTMRTGEIMPRVKLVTRIPCPHAVWFSRCWGIFSNLVRARALEMLQAPRHLNPALDVGALLQCCSSSVLNECTNQQPLCDGLCLSILCSCYLLTSLWYENHVSEANVYWSAMCFRPFHCKCQQRAVCQSINAFFPWAQATRPDCLFQYFVLDVLLYWPHLIFASRSVRRI